MADTQTSEQPGLATATNQVAHVIGIMSGKGGVGKSLVTGLLAGALRRAGYSVGILDADITGPSIPLMFGLSRRPEVSELGIFPILTRSGIAAVSINLFLDRPDEAVIWRGPLISNLVRQFWQDVHWGKLDYLLVDLPPGTADVPLTLMQSLPLDGMVIVTSPQNLAALVVRKAVDMCEKMHVPILGLVQNMAYLTCPGCGRMVYPFGEAEGERLAREMGVPHLLDLPIDPALSAHSDQGTIEDYAPNPFATQVDVLATRLEALRQERQAEVPDASDVAGE